MLMKKVGLTLVLATALVLAFSGVAYANMAIHGGYLEDTDACAGCHRAHTSFADIGWTDAIGNEHESALLISSAVTTSDFCYACHGDDAPGASTNVVSGVFDGGPSGEIGDLGTDNDGVTVLYETNSSFDATLNGGGFSQVPIDASLATPTFKSTTSVHNMDAGSDAPVWGFGDAASDQMVDMTCTHCHDPHGSSNYRLLKDTLFTNNTVGGYVGDVPQPFVISAEENYPTGGWLKHEDGQDQMAVYLPNYTTAEYSQLPGAADASKNISGWCAGCHEVYNTTSAASSSVYDYDETGPFGIGDGPPSGDSALPATGDYHRHATNWTLAAGDGTINAALNTKIVLTDTLPLELKGSLADDDAARADFRDGSANWTYTDYMGCLTCHRAHGTSNDMTGWAEAYLEVNTNGDWTPVLQTQDTTSGVDPAFSSSLLRADNRGVCERCHNK